MRAFSAVRRDLILVWRLIPGLKAWAIFKSPSGTHGKLRCSRGAAFESIPFAKKAQPVKAAPLVRLDVRRSDYLIVTPPVTTVPAKVAGLPNKANWSKPGVF